jgi:hypothetical protein
MTDKTIDPAASAAGKALRALRKTHFGRPAAYHNCPHCSQQFRAKDIRHHRARCDRNPYRIRRVLDELSK